MLNVVSISRSTSLFLVMCLLSVNSLGSVGLAPATSNAATAVAASASASNVKSYLEWKNSKISEIETRVKSLREKMNSQAIARTPSKDPNLSAKNKTEAGLKAELQDQLDQELLNLSITQDLTISDYFVGYLTKQPSLDAAIHDVSGRLTAEEVAELMGAFAQYFFQSRPSNGKLAPKADSSSQ